MRTRQQNLRLNTHGGKRAGAGRKPVGPKAGVPHRPRQAMRRLAPVHVTLRMEAQVWNLRSRRCFRIIDRALMRAADRWGVRIVQFAVLGNHIHLLVEAGRCDAMGRAMQGLCIRIGKGLNRLMTRRGRVFADRYHSRLLRTPAEVRAVRHYIRTNPHKHYGHLNEQIWSGDMAPGGHGQHVARVHDRRSRPGAKPPDVPDAYSSEARTLQWALPPPRCWLLQRSAGVN